MIVMSKQRAVANGVMKLVYDLSFYKLFCKPMIVFQRMIILSNLNYEITFHTGALKAVQGELSDPYKDFSMDIASLITTVTIAAYVPLVD